MSDAMMALPMRAPASHTWFKLCAAVVAGALAYSYGQYRMQDARQATFLRFCPSFRGVPNHFVARTPEGRVVIVSFLDIPEGQLSTFCPGDRAEWPGQFPGQG